MKTWATKITAIDPLTGVLKEWVGPNVPGITLSDAENFCLNCGLGYCQVTGDLVAEGDDQEDLDKHWSAWEQSEAN